jgi:hypothetical protein
MEYNTPSDEIFNDIKEKAIDIWETYDDTYGYASEKIDYINRLTNYRSNYGTIVGMFDHKNQLKLLLNVSSEARDMIMKWLGYNE